MTDATKRLAELAAMIRDAELAKLKKLQDVRHRFERDLHGLHTARRDLHASAAPDLAHRSGSDGRWLVWASRQSQLLSLKSASAAADAEAQMVKARRALGRADVLEKLTRKT